MNINTDDLMTVANAATRLRMSPQGLYLAIREKRVNKIDIDGVLFVSKSELEGRKFRGRGKPVGEAAEANA